GHGTATPLGDPIEVEALTKAFRAATERVGYCALGSVKSNIGHLDAAAGVAGLIKTVLMLEHGEVAPSLHFTEPNPKTGLTDSPFFVAAQGGAWEVGAGERRRAGVSSFGLGGTNVHLVLEEFVPPQDERPSRRWQTLLLSAKTPAALEAAAENLAAHLEQHPETDLADAAYTLAVGRREFGFRRALACADAAGAVEALRALDPARVAEGAPNGGRRSVAFMFPGGGAHYVNMCAELYRHEPTFREEIDLCARLFEPHVGFDVREVLYPSPERADEVAARLLRTSTGLPALFATEYALARLWMSWGVEPSAMIGHSLGEYAAACLAGVFSLEDAVSVVALRGQLFERLPEGAMLSVPLPEAQLRPRLGDELSVAAVNGPALCVASGTRRAVEALAAELAAEGIDTRRIQIDVAAHSSLVSPILDEFTRRVGALRLQAPKVPFISNVTGTWITADEATDARYWARHLRETVRFGDGVAELLKDEGRVLLEVGPGNVLTTLAKHQARPERQGRLVACVRHPYEAQSDLAFLAVALGRLWVEGVGFDKAALFGGGRRRRIPLPPYPFERQRHWVAARHAPQTGSLRRRSNVADWFYVPAWRHTLPPRPPAADSLREGRSRWLVFTDDGALSCALVGRLTDAGCEVWTVRAGEVFKRDGERSFVLSPDSPEDYSSLLRGVGEVPATIVHLWSLSDGARGESDAERFADCQRRGYYSLLNLARALSLEENRGEVELNVVTNYVHDVSGAEETRPEQATVLAPCKVVPQEDPLIRCLCVDVGPRPGGRTADLLLAEIAGGAADPVVAYRGGRRLVQDFDSVRLDGAAGPAAQFRERGVYLITGGFGTVGTLLAKHLAETARARLALVGRTPLPERREWPRLLADAGEDDEVGRRIRTIEALEASGAEVLVLSGDVADETFLRAAVEQVERRFGALDGVLHAAGTVRGASILNPFTAIGREESEEQFRSKVYGVYALERVLAERTPDFCLLFSSNASVLGGLGLVAYSAANQFLDAFALDRGRQGATRWISASWDGWSAGPNTNGGARQTSIAEYAMSPAESLDAVGRVLARVSGGHVVVSAGDLSARKNIWLRRQAAAAEEGGGVTLHERPRLRTTYEPPSTEAERLTAEIWQALLGIEQVGVNDNFFELGGHSLLATQVISRVRNTFKIDLPLRSIFEAPTLGGLAARVEACVLEQAGEQAQPIVPAEREGHLPLSFAQQRLWFIDQFEPGQSTYNIPGGLRLSGELDAEALDSALNEVVRRHEVLRTRFVALDGSAVQVVEPEMRLDLPVSDLRHLPRDEREREVCRMGGELAREPFDLSRLPLVRARLARTGEREHVLLFTMHHIVSDGWSVGVLVQDVAALYRARLKGEPAALPELAIQYADYAVWQRGWLRGEVYETQLSYWKRQLAGEIPALQLPADRPRPALQTFRGSREQFSIPAAVAEGLRGLAQRENVTLFMLLLAALDALLYRYTGQGDIVVGTAIANRTRKELEGLLGFFINTLALRVEVSDGQTFLELLARVREVALGAYAHQDVPFEKLVEELQPERDLSRPPLFQVMLVLQNAPVETMRLEGLTLDWFEVESETAKFDLTLSLMETGGGINASLEYNSDLFERATIRRLCAHFETLLAGVVENPQERIARLPLLGEEERAQLVRGWNETAKEYDDGPTCLHQFFERQAGLTPDAPALVAEDAQLSYGELNRRADLLAEHLRRSGVGPESLVGVCLPRRAELVVSLLAVLKAGAAYLPLDPEHPAERVRWMMQDAGVRVVLTEESLRPVVEDAGASVVCVEGDAGPSDGVAASHPGARVEPENLAYVLYTSGSTGRPKGVMVSHEAIRNRLLWMQERYRLTADDRVLQKTPFSFDVSVWEFFWPLMTGACLVLARPGGHRDGEYLIEVIRRQRISVLHFVPSMLEALLQQPGLEACTSLREVICSGEALPRELQERFHARQQARLHNLYGPTEAAVDVTAWECERGGDRRTVPIGRPIANIEILILDAGLNPVPVGVAGELHIGGVGLARGYAGRPGLTAERFIPNPFGRRGGERLYKTGDLARFTPGGVIEYLGRIDGQVKIRGNRVELGEVEAALLAHDAVREAVVVARAEQGGQPRLVAYVTSEGEAPDAGALRRFLQNRLPDYMVPSAFVALGRLPLTPNGKVDRKALPAPGYTRPESESEYVGPRSRAEQVLCDIWSEVLRVGSVGVHDNFFALGGDSILSIQIVARAQQAGLRVTPKQLFGNPTVAGLAAVAGRAQDTLAEQGTLAGESPLTPIQRWFFEQRQPAPAHFNQALLLEVPAGTEAALMRQALAEVVAHHDALRLRFTRGEGGWRQAYSADVPDTFFTHVDLSGVPGGEQRAAVERRAAELQASLDISAGPPLRAALMSLGAGRPGRLLLVIHHLAVDGVSWRILLQDLQAVYRRLAEGAGAGLPAKTTSYRQWAERLAERAGAGMFDDELAFWLAQTRAAGGELKVDAPSAENTVATSRSVVAQLDEDETRALLQEVPGAFRTQINDALLAALALAFERWQGSPRVLVDLEGHGREDLFEDIDLSRTVGWFTSLYPVALAVAPGSEPAAALKEVKEQLRSIPNRGLGYGVLRYLSPDAGVREALAAQTRAQVSFNYLGQLGQAAASMFRPAPESAGRSQAEENLRTHVLDFNASVAGGRLHVACTYGERLHERAEVERLVGEYVAALRRVIDACREGAWGYTPSDFPFSGLGQQELDRVVGDDRTVEDVYALSPMQHGLLFHTLLAPDADTYFEQIVCRLEGDLDAAAFGRAWQEVVDRHAALRSSFVWEGVREPVQVVRRGVRFEVETRDVRGLSPAEQAGRLEELLGDERRRGFDLARAPLMRALLLRAGDDAHHFVFGYHHILMDGWSMPLLLKDVLALYESHRRGRGLTTEGARPYRDYIAWLRAQDVSRAEDYWRATLAGFTTPTPLPLRAAPKPGASPSHESRNLSLGAEATAALEAMARRHGLTLSTLVHGAWALLLSRYSGARDVVFGTTVSGRPAALDGVERMIGLFINTLPVRAEVEPAEDLVTWLKALQTRQLELREYEYSPLAQVQSWSGAGVGQPLFESILVFENYPVHGAEAAAGAVADEDLRVTSVRVFERTHYPLTLIVVPGRELSLLLGYDGARFESGAVERVLEHLRTLLEGMPAAAGRPVAEVPMLSEGERRLLAEWRGLAAREVAAAPAGPACLHEFFERQAALTPDAVALYAGDSEFTYRQLNERANRLARLLRDKGAGPESLVGVCLSRRPELVVALLAVLKAGAAYVPLDPAYPPARVEWMLADAGARLVITEEALLGLLSEAEAKTVCVDGDAAMIEGQDGANMDVTVAPDNLAYVLYTSGSTGRPKGVAVEHRSAANFVNWALTEFAPEHLSGVLFATSVCFDLSVFELFAPLACGGGVVLAENALELARLGGEAAGRVRLVNTVPSVMGQLLDARDLPDSVRVVNLAGEPLAGELARRVYASGRVEAVRNLYGPTEATTYATQERVAASGDDEPTVGRGMAGTEVYVLDGRLREAPLGVTGEVYLGGVALARGYLNRPDLTAERFVPHPFSAEPGARLYRTGDLGRLRADGRLEYLGRADEQVKVRGYRVELGEVEAAARSLRWVRACAAVARGEGAARRLVLYVERDAEAGSQNGRGANWDEAVGELRASLRERLPGWMVPEALVEVERMPLNANGKIDRRALPDPQLMRRADAEFKVPSTEAEKTVAATWREVLKLDAVAVDDNFFEVGGNSLHLMQVSLKLTEAFGRDVPLRALFNHPTVGALVEYLQGEADGVASVVNDESQAERLTVGRARLQQRLRRSAEPDARRIS
ncbi:MAG TPA: amino acid adenylation domain-containing protein, partial [Pyrinomonadaceae bacterium]